MPLLTIEELHAGYGEFEVLHDVSLRIDEGEIVALIGPNGAGKSTVLKAIFSQADKTSGVITFQDRDITREKTEMLLGQGIAYVPQGRPVFSRMSVEENLRIGGFLMRDKAKLDQQIEELFARFSVLKQKRKELARNLSGGQQQLCAIARGLIMRPRLILLDEPSLGLAPKICKEIFFHLASLVKEGVSLLVVEQNVALVLEIAHRGYLLGNGQVVHSGAPDSLREHLDQVYLGAYGSRANSLD